MNAPFSTEAISTFIQSLVIMLEGMTGIFVFMAVFYGLITLLNYIFRQRPVKDI